MLLNFITKTQKFTCLLFVVMAMLACGGAQKTGKGKTLQNTTSDTIRFVTYNASLSRNQEGQLTQDLISGFDKQIQNIAAIIQHLRPDVLALMEFDYDPSGLLPKLFQQNYLSLSQHGEQPIHFPYQLSIPSNTGMLSSEDLNGDGKISLPDDAFGFGRYPGQYAFVLFSRFPIDTLRIRSFQHLLWKDFPDARLPKHADGTPYYSDAALGVFRLSSKNHIDIPFRLPSGKLIHTILAHPTPPVFDGPEDRNGLRNFDEIRLLKEYISGAGYLVDDKGKRGGLAEGTAFVVMGDLNADPLDGDSYPGAINQLLNCPALNAEAATGNMIPKSNGGKAHNKRTGDHGDSSFDTSFFGLRVDYVLPSKNLEVIRSGVFWPAESEPLFEQVTRGNASDHLPVWVDVVVKGRGR